MKLNSFAGSLMTETRGGVGVPSSLLVTNLQFLWPTRDTPILLVIVHQRVGTPELVVYPLKRAAVLHER
jgi:hypothetical protein